MEWEFIVALLLGVPAVLFPVALVWYLNVGGIYEALRKWRDRRVLAKGERRHNGRVGRAI